MCFVVAETQKCCTVLLKDTHYKNLGFFLFTNTRLLLSVAVEMRERGQGLLLFFYLWLLLHSFYCVTLVMGSYKQLCFNFFLFLLYFDLFALMSPL